MRMKSLWGLAVLLLVVTSALAGEKIVVKLGESAAAAKASKSHNVTLDALKKAKAEGGGEFWVKDSSGASHPFQLDAKQIGDLLDGSTVMVDAKEESAGAKPVRITLEMKKEEAAKPSGW